MDFHFRWLECAGGCSYLLVSKIPGEVQWRLELNLLNRAIGGSVQMGIRTRPRYEKNKNL